jgi:hypothetical protein
VHSATHPGATNSRHRSDVSSDGERSKAAPCLELEN